MSFLNNIFKKKQEPEVQPEPKVEPAKEEIKEEIIEEIKEEEVEEPKKEPKKKAKKQEPKKEEKMSMKELYAKEAEQTTKVIKTKDETGKVKIVVKKIKYGQAYKILLKPLITEKGSSLNTINKYVFEVAPKANKVEIAKAVNEIYGVMPSKVNIIKMQGKKVRRGRISGKRRDWKKAVVSLPKGKSINVYEGV
ncbi:MAG: 50S ribosomal protein L23 [bacterium]